MSFDVAAVIAIAAVVMLAGICAGAAMATYVIARGRRNAERAESPGGAGYGVDPRRAKWMRTGETGQYDALKAMRRRNPVADILTNVPLLSIAQPTGAAAISMRTRCRHWTVSMVLVDKRTGTLMKIVLRQDEADIAEKQWVLRQIGIKTIIIDAEADEAAVDQAMAA